MIIILFMNCLVLKPVLIFAIIIIANSTHCQNKGELSGSNKHSYALNYKIPGNTDEVFEGLSFSDLKRQEEYNLKHQKDSRKELLKSHLLKQTKPTRKRMKRTLKKSQRFLAGKPIVPVWQLWIIRKKYFSQRKENKNED